ncbi:fungal-specific transcription factor domain-containing protein [Xylariales sp. PMI_506]|nr:fungal-specific transcription factor domain-containing protein [Xylariales sp. PMI_506]
MPADPPDTNSMSRPAKRRKTQSACHPCRARKTGCDGERPFCNACVNRGWQDRCVYSNKPTQSPALALLELEKRLKKLEGGADELPEARGPRPISQDAPDFSEDDVTHVDDISGVDAYQPPDTTFSHQQSLVDDDESSTYDIPSNSSFIRDVARAAVPTSESQRYFSEYVSQIGPEKGHSNSIGYSVTYPKGPDIDYMDMVLPPRQLADILIQAYWEFVQPISPYLHWPTFTAEYEKLWQPRDAAAASSQSADNIVFYAILNMVFALGCQRGGEAGDITDKERLGNEFYRRSQKLVSSETIDRFSLPIVQLLILRGLFLLCSPYAERCWTVTGVAIGAAQAIGLDIPKYHKAPVDQITREMRRRIWYGCVVQDRLAAVGFGRRLRLLPVQDIPLPAEIDDEYLSSTKEGAQPKGIPSRLTYYNYNLRLSTIGDKGLLLQDPRSECGSGVGPDQSLGLALDISSEMDMFLERLPPHLRSSTMTQDPTRRNCFELQRAILRSRVLYIRLEILRPFLLAEITKRAKSPSMQDERSVVKTATAQIEQRLRHEVCRLCTSSAHEVLEEIHRSLSSKRRTSPWHALFFTFAAACILVAATLCQDLGLSLDSERVTSSWNRARQIFQFHSKYVPSAEKGIEALEWLRKCVAARSTMTTTTTATMMITETTSTGGDEYHPGGMTDSRNTGAMMDNLEASTDTFMFGTFADHNLDINGYPALDFNELCDPTLLDFSWFHQNIF